MGADGRADFRTFYTAGHMLRDGLRRDLYSYSVEKAEQDRLASKDATLAFIHPAVEAVRFVPLSFLSYRVGYFVFATSNFGIIVLTALLLKRGLPHLSEMWGPLPYVLLFCFLPAGFAIALGNTHLAVLLLLCLASFAVLKGNDWQAGLLTGLAIIRFQFTIPVALLFFVWKRWKFAGGLVFSAATLAIFSVMITGLRGLREFLQSLRSMTAGVASSSAQSMVNQFPGALPSAMPNLRGFIYGIGMHGSAGLIVSVVLSMLVFIWAVTREVSLPLAIGVSTVIGFHTHSADLVLLAIPIAFGLAEAEGWRIAMIFLPILISPFYPFFLPRQFIFVPALLLFLVGIGRKRLPGISPRIPGAEHA